VVDGRVSFLFEMHDNNCHHRRRLSSSKAVVVDEIRDYNVCMI